MTDLGCGGRVCGVILISLFFVVRGAGPERAQGGWARRVTRTVVGSAGSFGTLAGVCACAACGSSDCPALLFSLF